MWTPWPCGSLSLSLTGGLLPGTVGDVHERLRVDLGKTYSLDAPPPPTVSAERARELGGLIAACVLLSIALVGGFAWWRMRRVRQAARQDFAEHFRTFRVGGAQTLTGPSAPQIGSQRLCN